MSKKDKEPTVHLHPIYGVNPSVAHCFYCLKEMGVALLGWNGGHEAPREGIYSNTPCDECVEWMKKGIILIQVDGDQRTGISIVVIDDYIKANVKEPTQSDILKKRHAMVEKAIWRAIGLPENKEEAEPVMVRDDMIPRGEC